MEQTFEEVLKESRKEHKEKYYALLKSYGATKKQINGVKGYLKDVSEWYYEKETEKKLALLTAVGVPIDKICEHPGYLRTPMKELLFKAELALIEGVFVDIKYLQTTNYKEIVANYGARERGYLPKDRNIFYDLDGAVRITKMKKREYFDRFYSMKTFIRIHDRFRAEFPDFYDIFCSFPEFKAICVHSKQKCYSVSDKSLNNSFEK